MRTTTGLLLLIISLSACSATRFERVEPPIEAADGAAFVAAWQEYIDEVIAAPRQADCVPRMYAANAAVERRGAVVMIHGIGGCPQQFFELAERVSERGFDVLLPLLPGHGMTPTQDGKDDLSRLPDSETWTRYPELATRMNQIMASSPGTRVLAGFSLGGAVGLNAILQAPDLYQRTLLLAPMLTIRGGGIVEGVAELIGRTPGLQGMLVKPKSFREQCYAWQAAGRAGFCEYRYEHTVALVELEDLNRAWLSERPLAIPTQLVGAGDEKYVSNGALSRINEQQRTNGSMELCFLPDDVPHEMLTPYENVGREMYWLEGLLWRSVGFVVNGEFFPTQHDADGDPPSRPACRLDDL